MANPMNQPTPIRPIDLIRNNPFARTTTPSPYSSGQYLPNLGMTPQTARVQYPSFNPQTQFAMGPQQAQALQAQTRPYQYIEERQPAQPTVQPQVAATPTQPGQWSDFKIGVPQGTKVVGMGQQDVYNLATKLRQYNAGPKGMASAYPTGDGNYVLDSGDYVSQQVFDYLSQNGMINPQVKSAFEYVMQFGLPQQVKAPQPSPSTNVGGGDRVFPGFPSYGPPPRPNPETNIGVGDRVFPGFPSPVKRFGSTDPSTRMEYIKNLAMGRVFPSAQSRQRFIDSLARMGFSEDEVNVALFQATGRMAPIRSPTEPKNK